jgi:hypothetical protein
MVFLTASFARELAEKWLDLKSPTGHKKAEELRTLGPQFLSLHLYPDILPIAIGLFKSSRFGRKTLAK